MCPESAIIAARFIVVNVLPSPPIDEVTVIIFFSLSAAKYCMFVLSARKDSAIIDLEAFETTKLVALSLCPISPSIGIFVLFNKSDLLLMVSLKKSLNVIKVIGNSKPKISAIKLAKLFLGLIGSSLSNLAKSITLWSDSVPAFANDTSYLFCCK